MLTRGVAITAVGLLWALSAWVLSVPEGVAQSDYPAPGSILLPSIIHLETPTATPTPIPTATATPVPTATPLPCRPRPRSKHASQIVLRPSDLPSQYRLILTNLIDNGSYGDLIHSDVGTVMEEGVWFAGPVILGTRAVVFCTEQIARDVWPSLVDYVNEVARRFGEIQYVDIPVGDSRHAARTNYGFYTVYVAAFRKENVVAIVITAGFDGILTQDQVHDMLRRMRNKSD
jgi:hypothetical protein